MRKRAKHRLIGSAVLVLAGVVGFPLLFDTQPRPIAVDIPIEIPGKNTVKPLSTSALPAPTPAPAPAPVPVPVPAAGPTGDKVAAASSLSAKEEIFTEKKASPQVLSAPPAAKTEVKPTPKVEAKPKPEAKTEVKPEAKSETKPAPKPAATVDDGARARALLNGQTATAGSSSDNSPAATHPPDDRLVVQVGAFADATKAKEVRLKLEKAGLKTYTQVAETSSGKRIRVRVGPFASKAEAEKAASKIKALDLPAAILTL